MFAAATSSKRSWATECPEPPAGLSIVDPAPDYSLPDLSGDLVHLSDFRGRPTLVLFWSPSCCYCQRMLPHLLVWEAQPPKEAPRLLVVSTGSVTDNQAQGLRSPVVLEQTERSSGRMFGATGTPTAVLVDAEGRIASEQAIGAPTIFALATPQPAQAEMHRFGRPDGVKQGVIPRWELMKPSLSYLICATERTGSYLFCDALRATGIAGRPEECFRPHLLAPFSKASDPHAYRVYVQRVLLEGMTPNGVFEAKLHWSHLEHLQTLPEYQGIPLAELLVGIFPNLRYIHISRRDKLRQAVSFWKAMQTDI
jgi:thiol-disulfide isomerase/thioredoxin